MNKINIRGHLMNLKNEPLKTVNGKYFFIEDRDLNLLQQNGNIIINKLKTSLKKNPLFYYIIQATVYPVLFINGKNRNDFINNYSSKNSIDQKDIIVNIGSGNNTENDLINVDIFPFLKVDIVANADNLPFADNSVDKIIIEACIEHVANPARVIKEINRVLKKDGMLFIVAPFIQGYHDSPSDYWRWTKEGLKMLLKDFEIVEIGNKGGIASALGWILAEFAATALSFGYKPLHFIFFHLALVILIPFKLLDFIFVYYPTTSNISSLFYAIAKKK